MTWILGLLGGSLPKLLLYLLETWVGNKAQDAESRKIFLNLAKFMRENGVASAQSRFEAESQLQAGDDAWTKQEQQNDQSVREKDKATSQPPRQL